MSVPAFSQDELKVMGETPELPWCPSIKIYDYPVGSAEAVKSAFLDKKPYWQLIGIESKVFSPRVFPDCVARGWIFEAGEEFDPVTQGGGPDMFGIEWVYVPTAGGSMEKPGRPLMEDANDWREFVKFPDVDSWDWEGSAALNNGTYLDGKEYAQCWIQTGWLERLISFMDFEEASVAMIDEDQQDAIKELFDAISDVYIDIIDHYHKYYVNLGGFYIHDDWGSAQNTFFSPAVAEEMIVPFMRKVTDHIHELGYPCELHSCGHNLLQVPNMIAAGWDAWSPQTECNDIPEIYEKYGDQILISVPAPEFDPATTPEDEQRRIAREYAAKYCRPDKPSYYNQFGPGNSMLTPAFREELYIASREAYGGVE